MNEREQFEAAISAPPFEYEIDRYPHNTITPWPGQYQDSRVEVLWEMWQSRAKIAAEREAELTARVADIRSALQRLVDKHVSEMEGISSGMPTPEEWEAAVDDAAEALHRTGPQALAEVQSGALEEWADSAYSEGPYKTDEPEPDVSPYWAGYFDAIGHARQTVDDMREAARIQAEPKDA